jgi:hypothetical protein
LRRSRILVLHDGCDLALEPLQGSFALADGGALGGNLGHGLAHLGRHIAGLVQIAQLVVAEVQQLVAPVHRPFLDDIDHRAAAGAKLRPTR